MKVQNIFCDIPEKIEQESFERLVTGHSVTIERIVSNGQESPWFDQDRNEWVMVLKGNATLLFENQTSIQLSAGDFINIPAHSKHKVAWTHPDIETIWLAVHYL